MGGGGPVPSRAGSRGRSATTSSGTSTRRASAGRRTSPPISSARVDAGRLRRLPPRPVRRSRSVALRKDGTRRRSLRARSRRCIDRLARELPAGAADLQQRQRLPDVVDGARATRTAIYIEVWSPHDRLDDLAALVDEARILRAGRSRDSRRLPLRVRRRRPRPTRSRLSACSSPPRSRTARPCSCTARSTTCSRRRTTCAMRELDAEARGVDAPLLRLRRPLRRPALRPERGRPDAHASRRRQRGDRRRRAGPGRADSAARLALGARRRHLGGAARQPDRPCRRRTTTSGTRRSARRSRWRACASRSSASGADAPRFLVRRSPDGSPSCSSSSRASTAATTRSRCRRSARGRSSGFPSRAAMIRHRPDGRGHPYLVEPDQRVPSGPPRARRSSCARRRRRRSAACSVELDVDGERIVLDGARARRGRARRRRATTACTAPRSARDTSPTPSPGSASRRGRISWGATCRARRPANACATASRRRATHPWFEMAVCDWQSARRRAARRSETAPTSSPAASRGSSVRPRLQASLRARLEPGERVVGFGERFDGLDQRGPPRRRRGLRPVQGPGGTHATCRCRSRSSSAAHFGFHVDTGRRVRFDVGAATRRPDPRRGRPRARRARRRSSSLRLFAGAPAEVAARLPRAHRREPSPPPDWIYRLWMSGNEWNTQARVLAEVRAAASARAFRSAHS